MPIWDSAGDFFGQLVDAGEQEAINRITGRFEADHIQAQNAAVAEMGTLLDRFHQSLPHSLADYSLIENRIDSIARNFSAYAATFSNARAMRGAGEVTALSKQLIRDLESERTGLRQTPYNPAAGLLPASLTSSPYFVPALALGAVFILPRLFRGRR